MRTKQISLSSPMLLLFYKQWLEGNTSMRRTENGLCLCIHHFVRSHLMKDVENPRWYADIIDSLLFEMRAQFKDAGIDTCAPFNTGYADYLIEVEDKMCHLNPLRVRWVKDRIEDCQKMAWLYTGFDEGNFK